LPNDTPGNKIMTIKFTSSLNNFEYACTCIYATPGNKEKFTQFTSSLKYVYVYERNYMYVEFL